MKSIKELHDEFESIDGDRVKSMISFYENNKSSIDAIDTTNEENYSLKLRWLSEYGLSLGADGYYTEATVALKNAIEMFKKLPGMDQKKLYENHYYETLLFHYAAALWEIRKVKKSIEVFKTLVLHYPKNEKYNTWLIGLKVETLRKVTNPIWITAGIWLIGNYTFFNQLNPNSQLILNYFGVLLLLVGGALELYVYLLNRKKKSSLN